MEEKMKALWNYIFEVLYSDKTHLVYEHRTTLDKDGAFVDLPSPSRVAGERVAPSEAFLYAWYTTSPSTTVSRHLPLRVCPAKGVARPMVTKVSGSTV